jgi:hypothetical protein
MKSIVALLLPILALAAPAPEGRQSGGIRISSVSTSGSGCPQGSVSTSISDDGSVVTIGYDSYQTNVGPGVDSSQREKYCDIFLTLLYPLGCTSAVMASTYHGFAQLDSGVSGSFAAAYVLSPGSTSTNPPTTTFSSSQWSAGGVYTKSDSVTTKNTVRTLNQRTAIFAARTRVTLIAVNSTVSGTLTDDDATIAITSQIKC